MQENMHSTLILLDAVITVTVYHQEMNNAQEISPD